MSRWQPACVQFCSIGNRIKSAARILWGWWTSWQSVQVGGRDLGGMGVFGEGRTALTDEGTV